MVKRLDEPLFTSIVANTPLVSIDLVVQNNSDKVLLGKRKNRPAQNMWFVPGGIVRKDELISDAFTRLSLDELGVQQLIGNSHFLGLYEHFYPDNFSGDTFSTHYVVLGYLIQIEVDLHLLPKEQHNSYRWWRIEELLLSEEVHQHSKWYFNANKGLHVQC